MRNAECGMKQNPTVPHSAFLLPHSSYGFPGIAHCFQKFKNLFDSPLRILNGRHVPDTVHGETIFGAGLGM